MADYNREQVVRNNLAFSKLNKRPEDVDIYVDMDNTICLFSIHGKEPEALVKMYEEGYYKNLPVLDDAVKVLPVLQAIGFNVFILSACINSPYCRKEKMEWISYHLPTIEKDKIILCDVGEDKARFVRDIRRSILIDDFHRNIQKWLDAGGVAIKKTYSNKPRPVLTIHNFVEIFQILYSLGVLNNPTNLTSQEQIERNLCLEY